LDIPYILEYESVYQDRIKIFLTRSFCLLLAHYVLARGFTSMYYVGVSSATRRQKSLTAEKWLIWQTLWPSYTNQVEDQETSTASVTVHHMEQKQAKLCVNVVSLVA
jgi:hypothetical protein